MIEIRMIDVLIYLRVSTDDQVRGTSLASQRELILRCCEARNFRVIKIFSEDFSAKEFHNRPEFNRLLIFLKQNPNIKKIIVSRWDRFSRNTSESYLMIKKLAKMGVEVFAVEQPIDFNIPEQKMMLSFYLTIPEIDNDRRAQNTLKGMRKSMQDGRWVSTAPFGYKNQRDSTNKPILVQNEKASIVKQIFEMFATGNYHIEELRKKASKLGMKLSKNPFWTLLRNPVYYGKIKIKAYLQEPEEIVQGLHEPIINEDLFNRVQQILKNKKKIKAKKTKARDEFPLRGLLVCPICNKNLTGSISKGNGGRYLYYHCQGECNQRYSTSTIHDTFEKWLNTITMKPEIAELSYSIMEDIFKINEGDRGAEVSKLEKKVSDAFELENKAAIKLVNGEIGKDTFDRLKDSWTEDRLKFQLRIDELKGQESGFAEYSRYSLSILSNLQYYYSTSDLERKQMLVGLIFPEKLIFQNNSYRTKEYNEILDLLCILEKGSGGGKKKQIAKINDLFCQVARTRIELVFRP